MAMPLLAKRFCRPARINIWHSPGVTTVFAFRRTDGLFGP